MADKEKDKNTLMDEKIVNELQKDREEASALEKELSATKEEFRDTGSIEVVMLKDGWYSGYLHHKGVTINVNEAHAKRLESRGLAKRLKELGGNK